ncbi:MAG: ATP-binding cassette domain-containing protein [Methanomicrobiales archaeon]|nr:ATP-binding cassette domain-containing protein [Methanomicrobiales archaeon]
MPAPGAVPDSGSIIRIDHLTKIFPEKSGAVTAVDDVSFEVQKGEIFGLLGPNGAGKSTIIRILTTLLPPTSGTAFVGDFDVTSEPDRIRRIIGVCPQNITLDLELSAYDNLDFYGNLLGIDPGILDHRIMELLETIGLAGRANAPVATFSGGMRRKLEIVRAFMHKPLILFLDEPTIGLDPESRREVWQQVERLNTEETTIILTTHYMDEAEKYCDRIAFMDNGRLVALDTTENLRRSLPSGDLIEIGIPGRAEGLVAALRADGRITSVESTETAVHITASNGSRFLPDLLEIFETFGVSPTSIAIRSPSLEDVFLYLAARDHAARGTGREEGGGSL